MPEDKIMFVVWGNFSPRAEDIVAKFQPHMRMRFISYPRLEGKFYLAPIRYLVSSLATWNSLKLDRPKIILVQNPSIFGPIVVFLYSWFHDNTRFIIDSHSGSFNSPTWSWSLPIQRWLSRFAVLTLVHNEEALEFTHGWPGKVFVMDNAPPEIVVNAGVQQSAGFTKILVVSSFGWDEPIDVVLETAKHIPDVQFHITGDHSQINQDIIDKRGPNVYFTGYLPRDQYFQQLCSANAVMVLTTKDHTMLQGAWEAMYCKQPLILSDQRTLRSYFEAGAVFIPNTVNGMIHGVEEMRHREHQLRQEMAALVPIKRQRWIEQISEFRRIIGCPSTALRRAS